MLYTATYSLWRFSTKLPTQYFKDLQRVSSFGEEISLSGKLLVAVLCPRHPHWC